MLMWSEGIRMLLNEDIFVYYNSVDYVFWM